MVDIDERKVTTSSTVSDNTNDRSKIAGITYAILVVVLFSSFTLISRLGLSSSLNPYDIAALRFGLGALLLLPVFIRNRLVHIPFVRAAPLAFLGGLGFALFAYAGFSLAPAAHAAVLLHGSLSIFTPILALLLFRERPTRQRLLGAATILSGVILMASSNFTEGSLRQLLGDCALLAGSACWSGYGLMAKKFDVAPVQAAAMVAVYSAAVFLPIYVFLLPKGLLTAAPSELLLQGVFQGFFMGVTSIFIYTKAVSTLGASETALATAAVPCVTTLAAIPLLNEFPSALAMTGNALATAGIAVSFLRMNSRPNNGASSAD